MRRVTLVGGGLAGPLLAISLLERGFAVDIYERRGDMRLSRRSEGRSINLALSTRGIHALRQAGIWEQMRGIIVPMRGRMMHSVTGELTFQPYGKDETEVINSISRAELNMKLLDAAEARGAKFHFHQRCTGFDLDSCALSLRDELTGENKTVMSEPVIATDGWGSAIRQEMMRTSRFNFSQEYLDYGYKELTISAGQSGLHRLDKNALHIWPRGNYMLIALPNIDGTFACILFLAFEGEASFAELNSEARVRAFFEERFPDVIPLMPELVSNYFANPTGAMVTIKCAPWQVDGRALLLGDAAHAIVPFFGQGLNCAFEDCTYLLESLDRHGPDWARVFVEFARNRKADADAIADLARDNFVEMRDKVGDPAFLFKKKVELALQDKFPGAFVPKYSMVTFHRMPYAIAQSRGAIQERILSELCDPVSQIADLDWNRASVLIERDLPPYA